MASKVMNTLKSNSSVSTKDIEANLEQVKADIAALTDNLSAYGKDKASKIKTTTAKKSEVALKSSEETLNELRNQVEELSSKFETQIKEKPLQSIVIAAGIGAFLALLARK